MYAVLLVLDFVENHSCALFDWLTVSKRIPDEKERRYINTPGALMPREVSIGRLSSVL